MSLSFDHLGVVATDVARSVAFYVRLLDGWTETVAGHAVVRSGDLAIAVVPRRETDPPVPGFGHHLALRAPESAREDLRARLAELGAPVEDVRGRWYTRDPDGLVLELTFDAR